MEQQWQSAVLLPILQLELVKSLVSMRMAVVLLHSLEIPFLEKVLTTSRDIQWRYPKTEERWQLLRDSTTEPTALKLDM